MSTKVIITEQYLKDIGNAIRDKAGNSTPLKPSEMANAIEHLPAPDAPPTGTLNINQNGTHDVTEYAMAEVDVPPYGEGTINIVTSEASGTHNVDGYEYAQVSVSMDELEADHNGVYQPRYDQMIAGYNKVRVNVPNTYSEADEGKVVDDGELVSQSSKNISTNGTHSTTLNNEVVVSVPNTYEAADEGKVVDDGALVSQTSKNINQNGTHDTTKNNSVVVNVPNSYTDGDEGKVVHNNELTTQSSDSISTNGTYDTTYNDEITVEVPNSYSVNDVGKVVDETRQLVSQTERTLDANGVYDTTKNSSITVAVPTPPASVPQEILIKGALIEGTLTPNSTITIESPSTISPSPAQGDIVVALGQEQQGYVILDTNYLVIAVVSTILSTNKVAARLVYIEDDILEVSGTKNISVNGLQDVSSYAQAYVNVASSATRTTIQDASCYQGATPTVGTALTMVSSTLPDLGDYAIVLGKRGYVQSGAQRWAYYLIEGVVDSLDVPNGRFTMTPDTVIEDVLKVSGTVNVTQTGNYSIDVTTKKTAAVSIEAYQPSEVKMIPSGYVISPTGDPSTDTYIYITLTDSDMYDLDVYLTETLVCLEFNAYMVTGIIKEKTYNDSDDTDTLKIEVVNYIQ